MYSKQLQQLYSITSLNPLEYHLETSVLRDMIKVHFVLCRHAPVVELLLSA